MNGPSRRLISIAIMLSMILTGMVLVSLFVGDEEITVEAAQSGKDAGGYMWVDNNAPEPTIEFDWIDAANNPKSTYLEEAWNYYYYYGNHYQDYSLPFSFPFYDYTSISVHL